MFDKNIINDNFINYYIEFIHKTKTHDDWIIWTKQISDVVKIFFDSLK